MLRFNQHWSILTRPLKLFEETVGEATRLIHLSGLWRMRCRHLRQTTSKVNPGSPAEGGKTEGNSIKYEKMDSMVLSASCFVKSMFFFCACATYEKKSVDKRPIRNQYQLLIDVKITSPHRIWRAQEDFLVTSVAEGGKGNGNEAGAFSSC